MEILQKMPVQMDLDALLARVHVAKGSDDMKDVLELASSALSVASPKVVYDALFIEEKGPDTIRVGDTVFTSRVLRANLDTVERIFPYVATCGRELDTIPLPAGDIVREFWLDAIKGMVLSVATGYFAGHLKKKYAVSKMSVMHPGSGDLETWPIQQQQQLFSLFGDVETLIGVTLTDSHLMIPNKSVSGMYFATEVDFETCRICHREHCPSRQSPFDARLAERYQSM